MSNDTNNVIDFTARRNALRPGLIPTPTYTPGDFARAYEEMIHRRAEPDAMAILRMLASRAADGAADPQSVAHPDHELLDLCDQIVMLRRQENEILEEWQAAAISNETWRENTKRAQYALRKPLLRAGKLSATTAAGIYAKAVAVRCTGLTGVNLGKSLANDLLACTQLRSVLWPSESTQ
jgi:hypothetical protein